ncbi:hypothetical protein SAMN02745163_01458 [Clostridium cavendishii DSM 21758]|uniref:Comf operon protein A, DNA transporter ATPase n=1 Tax=Clostridium cavendishii DSM 21758 TaxID=1121302 RepID=A0A1M6H1X7_9CLOT|nr:hypothetical protein [Clostridium cavendishii]SHJ16189.1 hypothetical protein SAMN02745163_01458 [Clostridium cavendishii DSM 21758]
MLEKVELESRGYNDISNSIEEWYFKDKDKILNVIAPPYGSIRALWSLATELCESNKKVLYINSDGEACNKLIKLMKSRYGTKKYSMMRDEVFVITENFELVDCEKVCRVKEEYDLVIYDDISNYSYMSKIEIRNYLYYIYKRTKKLLIYSIEPLFDNIKVIEAPDFETSNPFVEPRFLTTRIDLNNDIPYLLYDYLNFFKRNNRKVVIYTPDVIKNRMVFDYFEKKLKVSNNIKVISIENEAELHAIKKLEQIKDKPVMIITCLDSDNFVSIKNMDAILYFADNKKFNYKTIVYICGIVTKGGAKPGEVLLVSNEVSEQMETSKDIARNFNKIAWDFGLLK